MLEKNWKKMLLGEWNTKTIATVAIGAALYGVLMIYGSIPVFTNTNLSTALLVPVIVGSLCGALPTAVALCLGNIIADLIGGWGMWFDWAIGNGIMGLFIGMLPVYGAHITEGIFKVKHAIFYAIFCVLGNVIGFVAVTPLLTMVLYGGDLTTGFAQALVATAANSGVLIIAGIPILFVLASRFRSRSNLKEE